MRLPFGLTIPLGEPLEPNLGRNSRDITLLL
jgi:hypothetical protein